MGTEPVCEDCGGAPDRSQDFACAECGRPLSACARCGQLVRLYEEVVDCAGCGPGSASPEELEALKGSFERVFRGLAQGREEMAVRSGTAYDRFTAMSEAWRAAGSPKKGAPGWNAWLGERNRLRLELDSKRARQR